MKPLIYIETSVISYLTSRTSRDLVSWNFSHLVGPDSKIKLLDTIRSLGETPALLTTPEELMETLP